MTGGSISALTTQVKIFDFERKDLLNGEAQAEVHLKIWVMDSFHCSSFVCVFHWPDSTLQNHSFFQLAECHHKPGSVDHPGLRHCKAGDGRRFTDLQGNEPPSRP